MAEWTDSARTQPGWLEPERPLTAGQARPDLPIASQAGGTLSPAPEVQARLIGPYGWPLPSSLSLNPDEARAAIQLPEFDPFLLEKARVISGRFPFAEAEYRNSPREAPCPPYLEIPPSQRLFRIPPP